MTNINYLVFIWNVFVDTLLLLIVTLAQRGGREAATHLV